MLRPRAIRSLLLDVAALRRPHAESAEGVESLDDERAALPQAARRALLVVVVDALAIAILFALRDRTRAFLVFDRSPETVFTLGVLLVAIHLGFRLAQYMLLQRVARALDDLPEERSGSPPAAESD